MNPDQRLSTVFSLVMIMATATLGWLSFGPGGAGSLGEPGISAQFAADHQYVTARLWEDPFQAIQAGTSSGKPDGQSQPVPEAQIRQSVMEFAKDREVHLMLVPVPETPFPGDIEARLRTRYSVQLALAGKDYAPKNRNYLGHFRIGANTADSDSASPSIGGHHMAYEWYTKLGKGDEKTKGPAILVVWLPENFLTPDPLRRIEALADFISCEDCAPLTGIQLIGPRSSDALLAMAKGSDSESSSPIAGKFTVFSPQATAPDALLGLPQTEVARASFEGKLRQALGTPTQSVRGGPSYFNNFIPTDDQLTDLLVQEFDLRGINIVDRDSEDGILIVAEADSAYGRLLPLAFSNSLSEFRARRAGKEQPAPKQVWDEDPAVKPGERSGVLDKKLSIYRYLRGLDQQKGRQSGEKTNNRPAAKSPEEALAAALAKEGAPAVGESQLDYVDRITADLRDLEEPTFANRRGTSSRKIRAVGVFGVDLYDKLILLRTLRAMYPDAVFFTTDLDARLAHPNHLAFTRNLIVASGYGLLPPSQERSLEATRIPPFRDVYQVALFEACHAALGKIEKPAKPVEITLRPRIYEIGRNGPEELEILKKDKRSGASLGKALTHVGFPELTRPQKTGLALAAIGGLIGFFVLRKWFLKATGIAPYFHREKRWIGYILIASVLLVTWAYSTMQFIAHLPGSEPWVAQAGISIWPTELMRVFVIIGVVVATVWSLNRNDALRASIEADYFPGTTLQPSEDRRAAAASKHARDAYELYLGKAAFSHRFGRVSLLTLAYFCLAFGLTFVAEGELPFRGHIRGPVAQSLDTVILIVAIFAFLWLLFYVLDSAWITSRLLLALSQKETIWPPEALRRYRDEFGVADSDLSGFLDVKFAAEKSREVGRMIIFPFAIQLLFIVSRSSYIDHWTWPKPLIAIFVCNVLLAWTAWAILRRAARKIRKDAEWKIQSEMENAARGIGQSTPLPGLPTPTLRQRIRRLEAVKKSVEFEHRGAYSRLFQDPAVIATFLPTGIFGILAVLLHTFFA